MAKLKNKTTVRVIDRGWNRLRNEARKSYAVEVGVRGKESNERSGEGIDNVSLGHIHEFGATTSTGVRIPSRSWLRSSYDENFNSYRKIIKSLAKRVYQGKMTQIQLLDIIGAKAKSDIQKKIQSGIPPALKASTLAGRRRRRPGTKPSKVGTKPLIDTGQFLNSITWGLIRVYRVF